MGLAEDEIRAAERRRGKKSKQNNQNTRKRPPNTNHSSNYIHDNPTKTQNQYTQRSVVRISYSPHIQNIARVLEYINREEANIESKIHIHGAQEINTHALPNEPHYFNIKISPEHGEKINMVSHLKEVIQSIERESGYHLTAYYAIHRNTAHVHAHLIIRGIDRETGNPIRFDKRLIQDGIRNASQHHATQELGWRTQIDIEKAKEADLTKARYTQHDKQIESKRTEHNTITTTDPYLYKRLQYLKTLGLAEQIGSQSYKIKPNLRDQLNEIANKHDMLKTLKRHDVKFMSWARKSAYPIKGKIVEVGLLHDDNTTYVHVKSKDRITTVRIPTDTPAEDIPHEGDNVVIISGEVHSAEKGSEILKRDLRVWMVCITNAIPETKGTYFKFIRKETEIPNAKIIAKITEPSNGCLLSAIENGKEEIYFIHAKTDLPIDSKVSIKNYKVQALEQKKQKTI